MLPRCQIGPCTNLAERGDHLCVECRQRYEDALRKWHRIMEPQRDALRRMTQLTAEDYATVINAR